MRIRCLDPGALGPQEKLKPSKKPASRDSNLLRVTVVLTSCTKLQKLTYPDKLKKVNEINNLRRYLFF